MGIELLERAAENRGRILRVERRAGTGHAGDPGEGLAFLLTFDVGRILVSAAGSGGSIRGAGGSIGGAEGSIGRAEGSIRTAEGSIRTAEGSIRGAEGSASGAPGAGGALEIVYLESAEELPPGLEDLAEEEPWWRVIGNPICAVWPNAPGEAAESTGAGGLTGVCLQFREDDENPKLIALGAGPSGVEVSVRERVGSDD